MSETDEKKSKSEMMADLRAKRKSLGLTRVEVWVKPKHAEKIKDISARMDDQELIGVISAKDFTIIRFLQELRRYYV